jgi:hypothetical protein
MSPEMIARQAVGTATDVWSAGLVMKSFVHEVSSEWKDCNRYTVNGISLKQC